MKGTTFTRRIGFIGLFLVFFTAILANQPPLVHTQDSTTPGATTPEVNSDRDNSPDPASTAAINCPEDPPMGERARLLDDAEIGIVFNEDELRESFYYELDNPRDGKDLVYTEDMGCQGGACKTIDYPAITMVDLEGNGEALPVMAYHNANKRVALGIPTEDGVLETWHIAQYQVTGKGVGWIDVAAGNLDGSDSQDEGEEVVIAFRDYSHALNLMIPVAIDVPGKLAAQYRDDTSNGRGDVEYVSVATGDLNGDGYDNEIITAFKDGNQNLQVMIFREETGSQKLKLLWARNWSDHFRDEIAPHFWLWPKDTHPIDVTTGDIDGDFQDEVIVAFRDANLSSGSCGDYLVGGHTQMLVLNYTGDGSDHWSASSINDDVWVDWDLSEECPSPSDKDNLLISQSIRVETADVDGDGGAEIVLAYAFQNGAPLYSNWYSYARLGVYDYVDVGDPTYQECQNDDGDLVPCLQRRYHDMITSYSKDKEYPVLNRIAMGTGDLDRDGAAEIVAAVPYTNNSLRIVSMEAKEELIHLNHKTIYLSSPVDEFDLALRDVDGDAVYGTYNQEHYQTWNSYVEAVIHSPPFWPGDNDRGSKAAFGKSVGNGGGSGKTSETSIGGSVTVAPIFHGIGPSSTAEWEKSCVVEETDIKIEIEGTTFKTVTPSESQEHYYMDAVGYHMCPRCCYEYIEDAYNTPVTVCLPSTPCADGIAGLDTWYKDKPHADPPDGVGDSWVPVGMNLSRGKPSEQSSTDWSGDASRAVDGDTDGVYANGSVSHTGKDANAWWQVDMEMIPAVHAVQLWNRTDDAQWRLSNFYVFLSEKPFTSDDPDQLRQAPGVWHVYHEGKAEPLTTIAWSDFRDHQNKAPGRSREVTGRYLKVQLTGTESLSLAEVQVWGVPSSVDQWPVAPPSPKAKEDNFTIELPDGSKQIVEGEFVTQRSDMLYVDDSGSPEFNTSLSKEWKHMASTSSASKAKVGFAIKMFSGEFTTGSKNVRTRIMTWSTKTEFSGQAGAVENSSHYEYAPYLWLQRATSPAGVDQAFLIVDYWVPYIQSHAQSRVDTPVVASGTDQKPQAPLINSSTHPTDDAWYEASTASFDWMQPPGDTAAAAGYHWFLDHNPETIPTTDQVVMVTSYAYDNLADGIWYLHVRAKSEGGSWSETAHRTIKIDTSAPEVSFETEPPLPSGFNNWHTIPITINVDAQDGEGSGVDKIEVTLDNVNWQPYTESLLLDADTSFAEIWVRAVDKLGHVSDPVSTKVKIDQTAPDSRVNRGQGPGLLYAKVVGDEMGNEHPLLAGAVEDALSGEAGMDLEIFQSDWTSADELDAGQGTWSYDGLYELSRGNYNFHGRSLDRAGNLEAIYDLGSLVWFPGASADLTGSSMTAVPSTARPGDIITFEATLRNSGSQEAWVQLSDTLPAGMTPVEELLPAVVQYDESTRTLTWSAKLLWPGEWHKVDIKVKIADDFAGSRLETQASAHAFWPNTAELPRWQRRRFEELEHTADFSAAVTIDSNLPDGHDGAPPWVYLNVLDGELADEPQVELYIDAAADAIWMFIQEWTLDSATGEWQKAGDSGWRPYRKTHIWSLSPDPGVKYIGVWIADNNKNISVLDEHSIDFTNRLSAQQDLSEGQRQQYRFELEAGHLTIFNLLAHEGDPDLYAWDPQHALLPNYAAENEQLVDALGFYPRQDGLHIVEVLARGESSYQLLPVAGTESSSLQSANAAKRRPEHPLTVSTPLSGTWIIPAPLDFLHIYMPLIAME